MCSLWVSSLLRQHCVEIERSFPIYSSKVFLLKVRSHSWFENMIELVINLLLRSKDEFFLSYKCFSRPIFWWLWILWRMFLEKKTRKFFWNSSSGQWMQDGVFKYLIIIKLELFFLFPKNFVFSLSIWQVHECRPNSGRKKMCLQFDKKTKFVKKGSRFKPHHF